jgi:peptidyl-prolyl cis-trans isomerase C
MKLTYLATAAIFAASALLLSQPVHAAEDAKNEAKPAAALLKSATSASDPVAKVGDAVITRGELQQAIKVLSSQQGGAEIPPEALKQLEPSTLDQLISAEILHQMGKKLEMKDLDKQVDFRIAQGKGKFASINEYEAALKSSGMSEPELINLIRKDVIINNLVEKEVISKIKVSDDDAKKFYDENAAQFKKEAQVKASHILIGTEPTASAEEKKKAKEKAEEVLKELKAGKDFAELAKTNSTCPSKSQGGDLGFFGKGQMVKPFEDAAFGLKKDELSGVVETQFGYHIIKLTDKKEAETVPLAEVKDKIINYLKNQQIQKGVQTLVASQKDKFKIEKLLQ